MSDSHYAIIFRGDILPGHQLLKVKKNLQELFDVGEAPINSFFTGQPVYLKKKLSLEAAQRYQSLLKKAGVDVAIKDLRPNTTVASNDSKSIKVSKDQIETKSILTQRDAQALGSTESDSDQWGLAQVGSLLVESTQQSVESRRSVDSDHFTLAPQEGHLLKDNEREAITEAAIDMDQLDWDLSADGESLLTDEERINIQTPQVDISQLTIAEAGADLLSEGEKAKQLSVNIDTRHLKLE